LQPFGKFDPPITIHLAMSKDSSYKFIVGEDFENNIWANRMRDDLGIITKFDFVVDTSEYESKVNMIIASGDVPDAMYVNGKQLQMMMDNDLITDMTDYFNTYASSTTLGIYPQGMLDKSKIQGRLPAIPFCGSVFDPTKVIWIRRDWMKNVGMDVPKTYDDLKKLALAFVNDDPDQDGQKDTFGISICKSALAQYGLPEATQTNELTGLCNAFDAYPNIWIKDKDGNLVYGSVQPEMKTALTEIASLFQQGVFDPEFVVKDEDQATELVTSNKVGIVFSDCWLPFRGLEDQITADPNVDWWSYPLVSNTPGVYPAAPQAETTLGQKYVAVRKGYEHPEAVMKMLNLINETYWGPAVGGYESDQNAAFLRTEYSNKYADSGAMPFLYSFPYMEWGDVDIDSYEQITKAYQADSLDVIDSVVAMNQSMTQQLWQYTKGGDRTYWWVWAIFVGDDCSQAIHKRNQDAGNVVFDEFYGPPTPTMADKMSVMDQLQQETFTKIITGDLPVSAFDDFVTQWNSLGGTDITKEVNDWYASMQ